MTFKVKIYQESFITKFIMVIGVTKQEFTIIKLAILDWLIK